MEANASAGLEPVQESFEQKPADSSDTTQDTHWRTLVQLTDMPRTYTFTELSALLEVNESTLRKRWWEKLELAYQYCPEALRVEVRTTKAGSPVFAFTEFGLQVFQEFKAANEEGYGDRYLQAVALQYPAPTAPEQSPEPEPATVTVEVGNHTDRPRSARTTADLQPGTAPAERSGGFRRSLSDRRSVSANG